MFLPLPDAAAAAPSERDVDEAITVTPAFAYIPLDGEGVEPGTAAVAELTVQNQTLFDADFSGAVFDARAGGDGSTALDFVEAGSGRRGAGTWLTLEPRRFSLAAGTQRTVRVRARIPQDAGAGGHFAGVRFVASQQAAGDQFSFRPTVDVPVFVRVAGDIRRSLEARLEPDDPWRWSGGPATWRLRLHNVGDVQENVSGRVRVDGLLAGERSVTITPGILLPDEVRTQRLEFDLRAAPDLYRARVKVDLDDRRPAVSASTRVVVLPWWLLVLVCVGVAIIVWRLRTRGRVRDEDHDDFEERFGPAA